MPFWDGLGYSKGMMMIDCANEEKLMTIGDVAAFTNIKVGTLRKYRLEGTLPVIKVGGLLRFRKSDIEAWLAAVSYVPAFMTAQMQSVNKTANDDLQIEA